MILETCEKVHEALLEGLYYAIEAERFATRDLTLFNVYKSMLTAWLKRGRNQLIARYIASSGHGLASIIPDMPCFGESDVDLAFGHLSDRFRAVQELATLSRIEENSPVLAPIGREGWEVRQTLQGEIPIDLFLGPYLFTALNKMQRANARLPETFNSPFPFVFDLLLSKLLERGALVRPWLTLRGGFVPPRPPSGGISLSYHTIGGDRTLH